MALSKKSKVILDKIDTSKDYSIEEAIELLKSAPKAKFNESVDLSVNLGIDASKSDQGVRGSSTLPHGIGKTMTVVAFADGEDERAARDAGADEVGFEDLIEKVKDSAENTFEKVWELPLWPEFLKQVKSEIADVKNIGAARQAGTIAGGAFLKEFVGDNIPWAHFDIAGTAWGSEPNSINPKGSATGWGIRLVLDMMEI